MLIFDQLKKDDPQLRFIASVVFCGLLVLMGGLWWVQVVSSRHYQKNLESQSIRTIRIPPMRGKILDREGRALAENRPSYNVDLYLEELSRNFQKTYSEATNQFLQQVVQREKQLGRKLTPQEKKQYGLTHTLNDQLQRQARYDVINNLVQSLSTGLQQPINITQQEFESHYLKARALPMPILENLNPMQIARFEEQSTEMPGMDLEVHPTRYYPNGTVAAHLLGYLVRASDDDNDINGEHKYSYRLPEFEGHIIGIEGIFEDELHGNAGERSVVVNNKGYKQSETIWSPAEPGENVVLTIDLDIQKAADVALDSLSGPKEHGAVVVMDVRSGDVLAMASSPTYDPNHFIQHPSPEVWSQEWESWTNEEKQVQMDHALQGMYAPGSIFKIVVGLAALEQGVLNPKEQFHSLGYYPVPGGKPIGDTAGAGEFDFDRALAKSSNPYFITQGLKPGVLPRMVEIGRRLHLGERTGLMPKQEDRGYFPKPEDIASRTWRPGYTMHLSIGQDRIAVTPMQIAVMISAVANGGTVYWPRLVSRVEYPDGTTAQAFPGGRVRDTMGVSSRSLRIVHEAMLADVQTKEGTGHAAAVDGLTIAGKTGTAEVEKNGHVDKGSKITWFASFAPYENPKYAVVAMVVSGASGGRTCAPLAHKVYEVIEQKEHKPVAMARKGILAETR